MPKGSKVHRAYDAMRARGYGKGRSARVAQKATGQALKTGRKPKKR